MKKRLGRPQVDSAHLIRAKAWFSAVSLKSGMDATELEMLFCKSDRNRYTPGKRPGLWGKYRDGEVCPKFKPDRNGCPSIVERVEERFPGTAQWMTMPFWDALSSTPMEMSDLKNLYHSLPQHIRLLIVAEPYDKRKTFWRKPIEKFNDLDAATAILALIKEAETTQDQQLHRQAVACWENYLEKCNIILCCPQSLKIYMTSSWTDLQTLSIAETMERIFNRTRGCELNNWRSLRYCIFRPVMSTYSSRA